MPRRDGDVFLLGTAMAVSPYVHSNCFPRGASRCFGAVGNDGRRAYRGTSAAALEHDSERGKPVFRQDHAPPRKLENVPIELNRTSPLVIAGLDPAIHAALTVCGQSAWMRGSTPRMTMKRMFQPHRNLL